MEGDTWFVWIFGLCGGGECAQLLLEPNWRLDTTKNKGFWNTTVILNSYVREVWEFSNEIKGRGKGKIPVNVRDNHPLFKEAADVLLSEEWVENE